MASPPERLAWTAGELAEVLGVSEWLIRRNVERIPHVRMGGRLFFPKHAIEAWLESAPFEALTTS